MTEIHTLDEMSQDPGGWDVATCTCGWFTPGCPDVDTAFEVLCAHINDARDAVEMRLRAFVAALGIETMHAHMDGAHQCKVRANGRRLSAQEWQIVQECAGWGPA